MASAARRDEIARQMREEIPKIDDSIVVTMGRAAAGHPAGTVDEPERLKRLLARWADELEAN